ncbi:cellulase family glycosylhydrolase [Streptomyces sp. NPDC007251]|uniref:glycoside hydrolase family 5 protein n=1 Tax=unclassified Streptomyces TaxID=2593676 RepID=UPI0033D94659
MFRSARRAARRATGLTRTVLAAAVALSSSALIGLASVPATGAESAAASLTPAQFHGVNWADPRDNYADDPVVLSGLSLSDDYATTYAKASRVIAGFRKNLQANTVRLPVNPYTVNGSSWRSYRAVIDAATAHGFKVVLSYWEGTGARKDGFVDDLPAFWRMWSTVTESYQRNPLVYFEPMNEPHGYTAEAWADLAAQWIGAYPSVPRNRIFVSGSGYNDSVVGVCADHRLDGTYLSLHHYGFWKQSATYDQWVADLKARIGDCASRTVADEFGAPMTTGLDYDQPASAAADPNSVAFIQADTDTFRALHMGAVYWPGLRTGDTYSIQTLTGSGTRLGLATTNASGADRLAWAWGKGHPATEG